MQSQKKKAHKLSVCFFEKATKFPLCVGIDPDLKREGFETLAEAKEHYKVFVNVYRPYCSAFKVNISFFEALDIDGLKWLKELIKDIQKSHPVILDGKRGDIGNTATMQARYIYEVLEADACTLNPYMGIDAIAPFLEYKDRFNFILALTSNPSSSEFQKLEFTSATKLYETVIEKVVDWQNTYGNVGVVFGASDMLAMQEARKKDASLLYLVPGVGAQGGSFTAVANQAKNTEKKVLINASRFLHIPKEQTLASSLAKSTNFAKEKVALLLNN